MLDWSQWGARVGVLAVTTVAAMTGVQCGDDGLTRVDRGELVVEAGGGLEAGFFVEFEAPRAGFTREALNEIIIKNGNLGDLTITRIEVQADTTGYITAKTTIPETPYKMTSEETTTIRFQIQIPNPNLDPEPLACPEAPANLPEGIDPDRYCGEVTISSGAPDNLTRRVYFQINSSSGSIAVDPTVLTFDNPQAGRELTQQLSITNEATDGVLTLQSIDKVDFTGGSDDRFRIDGFGFPNPIQPGETVVYDVIYSAETTDQVTGKLQVKSDDPNRPVVTVTVQTGDSPQAQIEVDRQALVFPEAGPGNPETREITVTNTGSAAALVIQNFLITPTAAREAYTVTYDKAGDGTFVPWLNGDNTTIARQNSKVFRVTYEPMSGDSVTGNLRILSNAVNVPNGEVNINLSGGAASPIGAVIPANLIFDVTPGEVDSREFVIQNTGLADLEISGLSFTGTLSGDEFSVSPDPAGVTVAPGELASFTLTYSRMANDIGLDQGSVVFETNDPLMGGQLLLNARNNSQDNAISPAPSIAQSPDGTVTVNSSVTLDGTGSDAGSGDIQYYIWTLISRPSGSTADLSNANGETVSLTPDVAGNYRVQLIVGNSLSLEGAATRDITVTE